MTLDHATRLGHDPMATRAFAVRHRRQDTYDTVTLTLEPMDGAPLRFSPGQFTMIGRLGVGEVPISISGDPAGDLLVQTVRDVGGVTSVLARLQRGDRVEVRGPYGRGWGVEDAVGGDVVLVAGGIGLAPLRPAVYRVLAERERYDTVALLYGARTPQDQLYPDELAHWTASGIEVHQTVDHAAGGWHGDVGLVTALVARAGYHPEQTLALVCGPEVMMRFAATALLDRGVAADRIRLSMERAMLCGVGLCGHCQLRELFVCVDGPVFEYPTLAPLLAVREV